MTAHTALQALQASLSAYAAKPNANVQYIRTQQERIDTIQAELTWLHELVAQLERQVSTAHAAGVAEERQRQQDPHRQANMERELLGPEIYRAIWNGRCRDLQPELF